MEHGRIAKYVHDKCRCDACRAVWNSRQNRVRRERPEIKRADRNSHLLRTYGISLKEYEHLLDKQSGVCAVCRQEETELLRGKVKPLAVDHDHVTGQVRGLLCGNCNRAEGFVRTSENAHRLALYMEHFSSAAGEAN